MTLRCWHKQGGQYWLLAEMLMNRVLQTTLPTTHTQRALHVPDQKKVKTRDEKLKQEKNFDKHYGAQPLSKVKQGTIVRIPMEGTVAQEVAPVPYLYQQKMEQNLEGTEDISYRTSTNPR